MRALMWDWPTRLGHWLLVALVAFSWWSAEEGHMDWHRYSGYTLLGLLAFRLYWGFAGSSTARFAHFVKGPGAVLMYLKSLRSSSAVHFGHNPLGGWSVLALLTLLLTQVTLGLFAVDIDGLESGPLSYLVSFDTGRALAEAHEVVFNVLITFITLHVVAVLAYLLFKNQNLIAPMFSGRVDAAAEKSHAVVRAPLGRVAIGVVLAAALVWWIA